MAGAWKVNMYCPKGHLATVDLVRQPGLERWEIVEPSCSSCDYAAEREPTLMERRRFKREMRRLEKGV